MATEIERLGIDMRAWKQRAETAEAEVERLGSFVAEMQPELGRLKDEVERLGLSLDKHHEMLAEITNDAPVYCETCGLDWKGDIHRLTEIENRWSQPAPRAYYGQEKVEDIDWLIAALKGAREIIQDQEIAGASLLSENERLKEQVVDLTQRLAVARQKEW